MMVKQADQAVVLHQVGLLVLHLLQPKVLQVALEQVQMAVQEAEVVVRLGVIQMPATQRQVALVCHQVLLVLLYLEVVAVAEELMFL
jgi:hypothetical protein